MKIWVLREVSGVAEYDVIWVIQRFHYLNLRYGKAGFLLSYFRVFIASQLLLTCADLVC